MDNIGLFFLIFNLSGVSPLMDKFMIFVTEYLIYLGCLAVLILGIKGTASDKKSFLLILASLPVAFLLIKLIHLFIFVPRPFVTFNLPTLSWESPLSASFPSRHATIAALFAFAFLSFKSKWWPAFLFVMILVGFSRIYVGVHYPSDVLGGFLVGAVSILLAKLLLSFLKLRFFR